MSRIAITAFSGWNDAGEAATDHYEGQGTLARYRISHVRCGFDTLGNLVAQRYGLFDGLQADTRVA